MVVFTLGESLWLLLLRFCLLPANCFHSFFLCCIFLFVLCITVFVLSVMGQKMLIVISGFACIYKCLFLIIIFNFSLLVVLFFPWEIGESMFCTAFLSKKTNLLDFIIKIGTWPSLSWFDQSLVIFCPSCLFSFQCINAI